MTLLNRLFGQLFNQNTPNLSEDELILKEALVQTDFFLAEYEQWKMAGLQEGMIAHIADEKQRKEVDPDSDSTFFHFRSAASNGFYFLGEEPWSNKDYAFLAHYFSSLLLNLGYALNHSSREVKQKEEQLITLERFYFKLPLKSRLKTPFPQLWGNLILEHQLVDDRTNYIKFMAHIYNDRSYEKALPFEELESILFSTS